MIQRLVSQIHPCHVGFWLFAETTAMNIPDGLLVPAGIAHPGACAKE